MPVIPNPPDFPPWDSSAMGLARLGCMELGEWMEAPHELESYPTEGGGASVTRTIRASPFMAAPPPVFLRQFEVPISLTLKVQRRRGRHV